MPKVYTPKEVLSKLKKLGFIEDRQAGSHKVLFEPETKRRAVVPFHVKEIAKGTMSSILREAKISREEFEKIK